MSTLLDSASSCFPCHSASKPRVPGWNESAGKLKELSIFWNRVWTEAGCPLAGVLSTIKRHAKNMRSAVSSIHGFLPYVLELPDHLQ